MHIRTWQNYTMCLISPYLGHLKTNATGMKPLRYKYTGIMENNIGFSWWQSGDRQQLWANWWAKGRIVTYIGEENKKTIEQGKRNNTILREQNPSKKNKTHTNKWTDMARKQQRNYQSRNPNNTQSSNTLLITTVAGFGGKKTLQCYAMFPGDFLGWLLLLVTDFGCYV